MGLVLTHIDGQGTAIGTGRSGKGKENKTIYNNDVGSIPKDPWAGDLYTYVV
jgi:hypothetical protein